MKISLYDLINGYGIFHIASGQTTKLTNEIQSLIGFALTLEPSQAMFYLGIIFGCTLMLMGNRIIERTFGIIFKIFERILFWIKSFILGW